MKVWEGHSWIILNAIKLPFPIQQIPKVPPPATPALACPLPARARQLSGGWKRSSATAPCDSCSVHYQFTISHHSHHSHHSYKKNKKITWIHLISIIALMPCVYPKLSVSICELCLDMDEAWAKRNSGCCIPTVFAECACSAIDRLLAE